MVIVTMPYAEVPCHKEGAAAKCHTLLIPSLHQLIKWLSGPKNRLGYGGKYKYPVHNRN
jgi:hypothetical protein